MTEPADEYARIVAAWERTRNGLRYIYNDQVARPKGLIVVLATFNQGGRYAMLQTSFRSQDYHFLHLTDEENSYYLRDDDGRGYLDLIGWIAKNYDQEQVVVFGSSMAGYAAIRVAVGHGLNALVNNPQLDLLASARLSWKELHASIRALRNPINLEDEIRGFPRMVLAVLHSRHRMDLLNMEALYRLAIRYPNLTLLVHQVAEERHRYLITREDKFFSLVDLVLRARAVVPIEPADFA